jgi:hypothetical protein
MRNSYHLYLLLLILIIPLEASFGQNLSLRKGAVVDSLPINDSISESFAMYLPTNFSNEKKWPIVVVFDPAGRGISSARLFSQASGAQGYLIAASNNISSQDSLITNLERGSRLLEKLMLNFPIDENRVYTAGLEEGALVASALPAMYPEIKGVIVVEDIWMNKDFLARNNKNQTYIGYASYLSDSYNNFQDNFQLFNILNYKSVIYNYPGKKMWPASNLLGHGLGNFTIQAMLDGNQTKDAEIVNNLYELELETARSWRRQLNFYKAYELLELMQEKYKYFDKKDEIRDLQKEIRRESLYKEQRTQFNSAREKERNLKYQYPLLIEDDLNAKSFENVGWWVQQVKELDSLKKSDIEAEVEIGARLQDFLQTYTNKRSKELILAGAGIDKLILISILQTVFDKENPEGYFNIISLSAQDGDHYTALLYLEDLLKTGYDNLDKLYEIPGTLGLKLSTEYNDVVRKYLGESRYYNILNED